MKEENNKQILSINVINSVDDSLNGKYVFKVLNNIDENTLSFYKDETHQIYRFNGIWRIAHHGVKVYLEIDEYKNDNWNIEVLNLEKYGIIYNKDIHILRPVIKYDEKNTIVEYSYLFENKKHSFTNKYLSKIDNLYDGIEGLISIFIPHCILTGKTIYSDIPVDKLFLQNLQNLRHTLCYLSTRFDYSLHVLILKVS